MKYWLGSSTLSRLANRRSERNEMGAVPLVSDRMEEVYS